jgi:hypothetical protein
LENKNTEIQKSKKNMKEGKKKNQKKEKKTKNKEIDTDLIYLDMIEKNNEKKEEIKINKKTKEIKVNELLKLKIIKLDPKNEFIKLFGSKIVIIINILKLVERRKNLKVKN